jgi:hypothetical protein
LQPILPDGQISSSADFQLSSPFCKKYFCFAETKSGVQIPPSRPERGALRTSQTLVRDAMDAAAQ